MSNKIPKDLLMIHTLQYFDKCTDDKKSCFSQGIIDYCGECFPSGNDCEGGTIESFRNKDNYKDEVEKCIDYIAMLNTTK